MGSLKVNITCGGKNMEIQQLKIEPDNWHHRFEISVISKMVNDKNVIIIEMDEVPKNSISEKQQVSSNIKNPPVLKPVKAVEKHKSENIPNEEEVDNIDGSIWL